MTLATLVHIKWRFSGGIYPPRRLTTCSVGVLHCTHNPPSVPCRSTTTLLGPVDPMLAQRRMPQTILPRLERILRVGTAVCDPGSLATKQPSTSTLIFTPSSRCIALETRVSESGTECLSASPCVQLRRPLSKTEYPCGRIIPASLFRDLVLNIASATCYKSSFPSLEIGQHEEAPLSSKLHA